LAAAVDIGVEAEDIGDLRSTFKVTGAFNVTERLT
jgi:hypothetical protein